MVAGRGKRAGLRGDGGSVQTRKSELRVQTCPSGPSTQPLPL